MSPQCKKVKQDGQFYQLRKEMYLKNLKILSFIQVQIKTEVKNLMEKVHNKFVYKYSLYILNIIILFSCNERQSFKQITIENISFDSPDSFIIKKEKSEDSVVYSITEGNKIIGYIYYGNYMAFQENSYFITEEKELFDKFRERELKAYYSKDMDRDYRNGIFNDNYYYYDTINKNIAQVMLPKKPNKGLIGIYFDSIDAHKNKLAIISNNLSEKNKKVFLEIFNTIKIKKSTH